MDRLQLSRNIGSIESRQDLMQFILELQRSMHDDPESWENVELGQFLSAMSAWVGDMHWYYENQGIDFNENQPWRMVADILYAAGIYE